MSFLNKSLKAGLVGLSSAFLLGAGLAPLVSAASASVYLAPASKSVKNGDSFTVDVRENPGGQKAFTVHVCLSYDQSKLTYVSKSTSGSPFTTVLGNSCGGFDSSWLGGGTTSDSFVARLTFKAKAGSGSTSISLAGSDVAGSSGSFNPSISGATVNFSTPTPPSSGSGGSSGGSSTTAPPAPTNTSSSPKPAPTKKPPVKPVVTEEKSQNTKYESAGFVVTSDQPTSVYIKYSQDKKHYKTTKWSASAKSHELSIEGLTPGNTYYYYIISKDSSGHTTTSGLKTLQTEGLTITVQVFDQDHQLLKNKEVTLHSAAMTAETNSQGVATFRNVVPGKHELSYNDGAKTYAVPLTVNNNVVKKGGSETSATQNVSVILPMVLPGSKTMQWVVIAVAAVVIIVVVWFVLIKIRAKNRFASVPDASGVAGQVVVGGAGIAPMYQQTVSQDVPAPSANPVPAIDQLAVSEPEVSPQVISNSVQPVPPGTPENIITPDSTETSPAQTQPNNDFTQPNAASTVSDAGGNDASAGNSGQVAQPPGWVSPPSQAVAPAGTGANQPPGIVPTVGANRYGGS